MEVAGGFTGNDQDTGHDNLQNHRHDGGLMRKP
jgi:hypothetical protein